MLGEGLMKGSRRTPGKRFETVPAVIWRLNMAFGEPSKTFKRARHMQGVEMILAFYQYPLFAPIDSEAAIRVN